MQKQNSLESENYNNIGQTKTPIKMTNVVEI